MTYFKCLTFIPVPPNENLPPAFITKNNPKKHSVEKPLDFSMKTNKSPKVSNESLNISCEDRIGQSIADIYDIGNDFAHIYSSSPDSKKLSGYLTNTNNYQSNLNPEAKNFTPLNRSNTFKLNNRTLPFPDQSKPKLYEPTFNFSQQVSQQVSHLNSGFVPVKPFGESTLSSPGLVQSVQFTPPAPELEVKPVNPINPMLNYTTFTTMSAKPFQPVIQSMGQTNLPNLINQPINPAQNKINEAPPVVNKQDSVDEIMNYQNDMLKSFEKYFDPNLHEVVASGSSSHNPAGNDLKNTNIIYGCEDLDLDDDLEDSEEENAIAPSRHVSICGDSNSEFQYGPLKKSKKLSSFTASNSVDRWINEDADIEGSYSEVVSTVLLLASVNAVTICFLL